MKSVRAWITLSYVFDAHENKDKKNKTKVNKNQKIQQPCTGISKCMSFINAASTVLPYS